MTRSALKAFVLSAIIGLPAAAEAAAPPAALSQLAANWGVHAPWFSMPRLSPAGGHLIVDASEDFMLARNIDKKTALEELSAAWRKHLGADVPTAALLEIRWEHGGWLWRAPAPGKNGKSRLDLVDRWDDATFLWVSEAAKRDRWFFFAGGQSASGGRIGSSTGFNLRLGTTLFRNRYDLSFLFNRTSTGPSPKVKANVFGVVGRVLFRHNARWGYNLGGQLTTITASGADEDHQVSAVGGLNFYQGKGTWDVSLTLSDEGSRTLVMGYSIFLNR